MIWGDRMASQPPDHTCTFYRQGQSVEYRAIRRLRAAGVTARWRGLGHRHNGAAHDITTVESAIRRFGSLEGITPRDGLRRAHLPACGECQDIGHIGAHPAPI